MGKTNELNKVVKSLLDTIQGATHNTEAPNNATYPYKVFSYENIDLNDLSRDDIILIIDIWDKSPNYKNVNEIADAIDPLLNNRNNPTSTILPTFYRLGRKPILDPDKSLKRVQLRFEIQNYIR